MKAPRFFTCVFVLLLCLIFLSGCGLKSANDNNSLSAETITIGGNFELTGDLSEFGKKGEKGARLAIKEINDRGGICGKKIKYIGADNKSDERESAAVTTKLIDQHQVIGIIGPMTNLNTLAAVTIVSAKKIPLITPTGTSPLITIHGNSLNSWLFRACFVDAYQGRAAAYFAYHALNAETAALIIDRSAEYSKSLGETFKSTYETLGGNIIVSSEYIGGQDKRLDLYTGKSRESEAANDLLSGFL
jgi:branched-chain amino acid transport system substrate-binding protein